MYYYWISTSPKRQRLYSMLLSPLSTSLNSKRCATQPCFCKQMSDVFTLNMAWESGKIQSVWSDLNQISRKCDLNRPQIKVSWNRFVKNGISCDFFFFSHLPNMIRFQSDVHKNLDWQSEQGLSGVCLCEELVTKVCSMGNAWIFVNDRAFCGVFSCVVWLSWTVFRCTGLYIYAGSVGIWFGVIYNLVSMISMP